MSGAWAVVPVKGFARGKSRLSGVLSRGAREELARSLCEHALEVLARCDEIEGVLVATDCTRVARFAEARGAVVVRDDAIGSLAQVVDRALGVLARRGVSAAVVLMSDLPLLTADDVAALVAALRVAPLVLSPDRRDQGTNALAISPPDRIATCFGSALSFRRHLARARSERTPSAVHRSEGLAFDLDSPDDLRILRGYTECGARFSWNRKRPSRVRAA